MVTIRNPLGDVDDVRDLARWCRDAAGVLENVDATTKGRFFGLSEDFIADAALEMAGRIVQRSNAVTGRGRSGGGFIGDLRSLGASIDAHADWMYDTWQEVRLNRPRIEAWWATAVDDPLRPPVLPPEPHDSDSVLEWHELIGRLRGHVVF